MLLDTMQNLHNTFFSRKLYSVCPVVHLSLCDPDKNCGFLMELLKTTSTVNDRSLHDLVKAITQDGTQD